MNSQQCLCIPLVCSSSALYKIISCIMVSLWYEKLFPRARIISNFCIFFKFFGHRSVSILRVSQIYLHCSQSIKVWLLSFYCPIPVYNIAPSNGRLHSNCTLQAVYWRCCVPHRFQKCDKCVFPFSTFLISWLKRVHVYSCFNSIGWSVSVKPVATVTNFCWLNDFVLVHWEQEFNYFISRIWRVISRILCWNFRKHTLIIEYTCFQICNKLEIGYCCKLTWSGPCPPLGAFSRLSYFTEDVALYLAKANFSLLRSHGSSFSKPVYCMSYCIVLD